MPEAINLVVARNQHYFLVTIKQWFRMLCGTHAITWRLGHTLRRTYFLQVLPPWLDLQLIMNWRQMGGYNFTPIKPQSNFILQNCYLDVFTTLKIWWFTTCIDLAIIWDIKIGFVTACEMSLGGPHQFY